MFWRRRRERRFRWVRLDLPGTETARLRPIRSGWELSGEVFVEHEGSRYELDYAIVCDASWNTRRVRIERRHAGSVVERVFVVLEARWTVGTSWELPRLEGCIDVYLAFTPATNALPIRRLNLEVGSSASVTAAWFDFPEIDVERLDQVYARESDRVYRYSSNDGAFQRTLTVDDDGFVVDYPGLWRREG